MEPFRVTCETCNARLKVRSDSVVGEIHPCPKCGSMVQIVPPADWSAGAAAGPSVAAGTPLTAGDSELKLGDEHAAASGTPAQGMVISTDDIAASGEPALPIAASASPWVFVAVSGAALLIVGGLVAVMWPGEQTTQVEAAAPHRAPVAVAEAKEEISAPAAEATSPAEPPVNPIAETVDQPPTSVDPVAESAPPTAATTGGTGEVETAATSKEPVDGPAAHQLPPLPAPAMAESSESAPPAANDPPAPPVMKFDPLDFDPSELTLAPTSQPAAGSIPQHGEVSGASADGPAAEPSEESERDVELLQNDRTLNVRLGPMLQGAPRALNAAEQLGLRVESLAVSEMPLAAFLDIVSELANLPLTLDPTALELTGHSALEPVSVASSDATVEKLLNGALAKLRLQLVEGEAGVRLAPVNAERRRAIDYEVADLVTHEDDGELPQLVRRFVAPEAWEKDRGSIQLQEATLRVEHTQNVRHQVLIFCERLRMARGLPIRSRYPAELLSVEPAYLQIAPKLQETTTFTFLPWSRLADVFRHWQEASGLTILVDWSALADVELGPSSPIACSGIDRTWADVLDHTLEPLELSWWPVNGQTIQITSREALGDVRRIEFYTVPGSLREQYATDAALVAALQRQTIDQVGESGRQFSLQIGVDPGSKRLIVAASPLVHRYLSQRLSAR